MNRPSLTRPLLAGLLLLSAVLSGCVNKTPGVALHMPEQDDGIRPIQTAAQNDATVDDHDPIEPVNRGLFQVHEVIDGVLLQPIAHIYRGVVPPAGQAGVRNALVNLSAPVVLLNSVLQGDFTNAGRTVSRFAINSTVGIAGIFDVASNWGIPRQHSKDFGQTLGVYGVPAGPYVFIPVLGPSDVRDTVGLVADFFTDPFYYILNNNAYLALDITRGVVKRTDLLPLTDRIHRDSFDTYVTYRSVYLQNRATVVRDYRAKDSALEKESGK